MQKLKDEGFNDIEDTNSQKELLKTWDSVYFIIRTNPEDYTETLTYYQCAEDLISTHDFDSETDLAIWTLHAQGLSVRDIEVRLKETKSFAWDALNQGKKIKEKINKDIINSVIQRLQKFIGRR